MPVSFLFISALLAASFSTSPTQQVTPAAPQGLALLQKSLTALDSAISLKDVTLSGSARRIAGSDDESGTATFKALTGTGSRLDLTLSSGTRSEIRNSFGGNLSGSWSGPDGVAHQMAYHNLLTDAGLFPALTFAAFASSSTAVITYVGAETRNGQAVQHLSASQPPPFPDPHGALPISHLSQVDFFLDSTTFLPVALTFNIHPDDNALLDIPIEIRFSDYRAINGAQIPFHIEKFLNNGLILDLQFQTATLNSGLSATAFGVGQ